MGLVKSLLSGVGDYLDARDEAKALTSLNIKAMPPTFSGQGMGVARIYSSMQEWDGAINQILSSWNGSKINYAAEVGDLRLSVLIMAAVNWAGTNASMGRWQVVELDTDEKETDLPEHPFVQLFDGEDNPDFQIDMLWQQWMASWVMTGEAFALFGRDNSGRIKTIAFEPRDTIRPKWDRNLFPEDKTANSLIQYFEINRDGKWIPWRKMDTFRVYKIFDPITRRGSNGVQALFRTIFTDQEREQYTSLLLRNSGVMPMAVAPKEKDSGVTKELALELAETLQRRARGDERGKPTVFMQPMEALKFATDYSADAMEKIAHIAESRVAAAIGISVQSLKFLVAQLSSTYNNVREFRREDFEQWVVPTRNAFRNAAQKQILRDMDGNRKRVLKDDYSTVPIMQPDKIAETRRMIAIWKARGINLAEFREAISYEFSDPSYKEIFYPVPQTSVTISPIDGETMTQDNMPVKPNGHTAMTDEEMKAAKMPSDADIDSYAAHWSEVAPDAASGLFEAKPS